MKSHATRGLVTLAVATLFLGACSTTPSSSAPNAAQSESAAGASAGAHKGTVTVLTHDSFALPDDVIARFTSQTGYTLKTTAPGDAGVVANQLILTKDNPTVDAVYGIDNYSASKISDAGVLADYTPHDLPTGAKPYELGSALAPIDMGDVCVNVDHAYFTKAGIPEPATLDDLAQPRYAKLFVLENPATSSPGVAFLVATIAAKGESGYQQYWKDLLNNGAKLDQGWSEAYETDFSAGGGKGKYPLVLSYSSSPAETEGATGSLPATCTRQVEYAGVVKGAKNAPGAQAFIDFMLSDDVQKVIPENMYMYPINTEIKLPEQWAKFASLTDKPLTVDAAKVAQSRDAWIKAVSAIAESRK
ncbi:MAG: thiamine ABC transporter substrate-binding protein [Actinomycetaceae bacterium]|nr:thiamine ABC transporter substrate-binding protein [Actinomycetaceae bacterium]MDY6083431.1 thiamine ABC transporter substrate-binding protein [Actinomycetaceae bacterium]